MAYDATKRLFCVRIHPELDPHAIVALLATSAAEAEAIARGKSGLSAAQTSVFEVSEGDTILVGGFRIASTSTAAP